MPCRPHGAWSRWPHHAHRLGPAPAGVGEVAQRSASISARVTIMAVMAIAIVPITTIATPMGTVLAGGTVTAIGTSGSFI